MNFVSIVKAVFVFSTTMAVVLLTVWINFLENRLNKLEKEFKSFKDDLTSDMDVYREFFQNNLNDGK